MKAGQTNNYAINNVLWKSGLSNCEKNENSISYPRGVFRTFELRVPTVIDGPKIAGAKGR